MLNDASVEKLLDSAQWQMETFIFTGVGVILPLFCAFGFLALLGSGIWRKVKGRPCGQTFALALAVLLLFIIFYGIILFDWGFGNRTCPELNGIPKQSQISYDKEKKG